MQFLDSILRRLGYIRLTEFERQLQDLKLRLKFSTSKLSTAIANNKPKP